MNDVKMGLTPLEARQEGDVAGSVVPEAGAVDLIERLELALGDDRKLDAEIALAIGWKQAEICGSLTWFPPLGHSNVFGLPHYTSSLDAALTLVPDGWGVGRLYNADLDHKYFHVQRLVVWRATLLEVGAHLASWNDLPAIAREGAGQNAAIALCIAALKARTPPLQEPSTLPVTHK